MRGIIWFCFVFVIAAQSGLAAQTRNSAPDSTPAPRPARLGFVLIPQTIFSYDSNLAYTQFAVASDARLDFFLDTDFSMGLSLGYEGAAPSPLSARQLTGRPGFDAFHAGLSLSYAPENSAPFSRLGAGIVYGELSHTSLFFLFPQVEFQAGLRYHLQSLILSPLVSATLQARNDPGLAWSLGAGLGFQL